MKRPFYIIAALALVTACSKPAEPPHPPEPAAPIHTAQIPEPPHEGWEPVLVNIVDIEGKPVPGAAPVAVSQPNAFEKPVAVGEPANQNGDAVLFIPPDQRLYVRAWDFTLQMFANNFYDVYPGPVTEPGIMKLVLVPAGAIGINLRNPDGKPAANAEASVMMSHPSRGEWWPATAKANDKGFAVFSPVPAGIFDITLDAHTGEQLKFAQIKIQPGGLAILPPN